MSDSAYIIAQIGQLRRFLADLPPLRVLERLGFESKIEELNEEYRAKVDVSVGLFGWIP